mmetsp:Transcript_130461/g.417422  ORF Transcript_130461/g.417422 Transcript_130461/m.417422 type:complete len:90 (+) Transcript_130461:953-1222(+)
MLTFDPGCRPSAASCLQHRYFSEPPAPQDPQFMPSFPEHRNEQENPRACAPAVRKTGSAGAVLKRAASQPLAPRSAVFAATKKVRSTIF